MKLLHSFIAISLILGSYAVSVESTAFLEEKTHELEKMYIEDCQKDVTPHGFYGAMLEPCEFAFFQGSDYDTCNTGRLLETPRPVHWLFKLQEHIDKDDWDNMSSDDVPDFDELMLWPDQCVGVSPRCYQLGTENSIDETLSKLFPEGIPANATHVRVDCRADAMELSRIVYSFSSGLEKSLPAIIACIVAVVFLAIVALACCLYGCCRLCNTALTKKYDSYQAVPATYIGEEYGIGYHEKQRAYQSA